MLSAQRLMFRIEFTKLYNKRVKSFLLKHPDLERKYEKTIRLLESNPYHPSLRLHKLSGNNEGLSAVSIDLSYRITIEFLIIDKVIIPIDIGGHGVYR